MYFFTLLKKATKLPIHNWEQKNIWGTGHREKRNESMYKCTQFVNKTEKQNNLNITL